MEGSKNIITFLILVLFFKATGLGTNHLQYHFENKKNACIGTIHQKSIKKRRFNNPCNVNLYKEECISFQKPNQLALICGNCKENALKLLSPVTGSSLSQLKNHTNQIYTNQNCNFLNFVNNRTRISFKV
ncbi:MAG: hypothetical protein JSU07_07395 [Bacteroidetes bacterium]|nr:hypothetical protein [Bacteroidota bacterium]